ncbi:hypothetical protein DSO57_1023761 [Entomophthora muscae]|uniref:Uncharacterized protein n=1 Tax=Entomophthora muscae TaxID=34485 RepID=A0ACC2TQ57_9FUNG|nr:hypothetical protein DSO57_1023761 [Entomophthora muscae]
MFYLAFGALLSFLANSAQAGPISANEAVSNTPTDVSIPSYAPKSFSYEMSEVALDNNVAPDERRSNIGIPYE